MIGSNVELILPFNGETRLVPIEAVFPTFISIRWGMSGLYNISLKTNIMIARSIRARRKGQCYWKVKDIDELRKRVADYLNKTDKTQFNLSFEKHTQSMPTNK